jgi:hypothetical protein
MKFRFIACLAIGILAAGCEKDNTPPSTTSTNNTDTTTPDKSPGKMVMYEKGKATPFTEQEFAFTYTASKKEITGSYATSLDTPNVIMDIVMKGIDLTALPVPHTYRLNANNDNPEIEVLYIQSNYDTTTLGEPAAYLWSAPTETRGYIKEFTIKSKSNDRLKGKFSGVLMQQYAPPKTGYKTWTMDSVVFDVPFLRK